MDQIAAFNSTPTNPVKAVTQKVKSAFSSSQQPSIRIIRERSTGRPIATIPTDETKKRWSFFGHRKQNPSENTQPDQEYDNQTVDILDVVDPEVSTLSTLTNVQNSLFVPSLGSFVNRRPKYTLYDRAREAQTVEKLRSLLHVPNQSTEEEQPEHRIPRKPVLTRTDTIQSTLSESRYAVLPHGETLEGWSHEDKLDLDDMVRHQLHSRRARMKRTFKGFGQYVRRPLGLFVTVYATLITLFGAAWVLFLIGWISLGSKRDYVINIVDNVLVALFAIMGDGLAPFRAVDTYHMIYIAHYHRKTWKKRKRMGLPALADHNDLPEQRKEDISPQEHDVESLVAKRLPSRIAKILAPRVPKRLQRRMVTRRKDKQEQLYEYTVLNPKQQEKLEHHERKFSKSHTFYKPHETETHYAFPLKLLVAIVVLLDMHSCLQISLGACTWGIPYKNRPFALTTVILCCSITCNILGGVLISVGDRRTRKRDVIERILRQQLTAEAIRSMQTAWLKAAEQQGRIDRSVRERIESEHDQAASQDVKAAWKRVPLLPKTLLGKGVDHRQPSLPQAVKSGGSGGVAAERRAREQQKLQRQQQEEELEPEREPVPVAPANTRVEPQESRFTRVMRLLRRADMDRS